MRPSGSLPAFQCRSLLLLLGLAIVLAHALGLVHRTLHGPDLRSPAPKVSAQDTPAEGHAHDWLASLFDDHDDQAKCRLLDALTQGGPQVTATLPVLPPVAAGLLLSFEGAALARWAALFDARGPPSLR
jgi:hypothetical protein